MTVRLVGEIPQVPARDPYQGIAHTIVQYRERRACETIPVGNDSQGGS